MNVLLVCPYFPPENTIAAERVGKFAQHLTHLGHQVRVVARVPPVTEWQGTEQSADLPGYPAVLRFSDPTAQAGERLRKRRLIAGTEPLLAAPASGGRIRRLVSDALRASVRGVRAGLLVPDPFVFWSVRARRAEHSDGWMPDVIVASGGPISSFVVGARLSKKYGVPWVADYRDLLASGDYYLHGPIRRFIDRRIEKRAVLTSAARTTVSSPLAQHLEAWLGGPCDVVQNGFDPDDFQGLDPLGAAGDGLTISFCGYIYRHRRDPTPLFRALGHLAGEDLDIKIRFYGTNVYLLQELAEREGVLDKVEFYPRVSHAESLRIQVSSDVLLQLMWNDPSEVGTYTGKLYEYIGARRPILMLGYEQGVAADLIRERSLGVVANEPDDIAAALRQWAKEKTEQGRIPPLPPSAGAGLSRQAQAERLQSILLRVTGQVP